MLRQWNTISLCSWWSRHNLKMSQFENLKMEKCSMFIFLLAFLISFSNHHIFNLSNKIHVQKNINS